jgi:hypothetical protein
VPEEHHVVEVLVADAPHHVVDVAVEVDPGTGEVGALAEAGEGDRVDLVPALAEPAGGGLPHPAAEPRAGHQHERGHGRRASSALDQLAAQALDRAP